MEDVEVIEVTNRDDNNEKFYIQFENYFQQYDLLIASAAPAAHAASMQYTYVYRKMSKVEFEELKKNKAFKFATTKKKKVNSAEKWFAETMHHTSQFNNRGVVGEQKVGEIEMQKLAYDKIRKEAIPQDNSGVKQPKCGEGKPYNITNKELIKDCPEELNIGIKGQENLDQFNKHIVTIREVEVETFRNYSAIMKWIKRNKVAATITAIGIVIDATNITLSLISDDGKFGHETQITTGEIVGGFGGAELSVSIGAQIGAALGSVVPGIGNFIVGFIGGVIGSVVGGCFVRYFLIHFENPVVNLDDMPVLKTEPTSKISNPPYDSIPGVFGVPRQKQVVPHGVPAGKFNLDSVFGVPAPKFNTRGRSRTHNNI